MSDEEIPPSIATLFGEARSLLMAGTTLSEAYAILEHIRDSLNDTERTAEFFEDKGLPLREAWVAVQFGLLMGYERICLAPKAQEGFDVTLFAGETSTTFDITEARDYGYDREASYRCGPDTWLEDDEEMSRQEALFSKAVGNRLKKKKTSNLIVYVNTGWLPDDNIIESLTRGWHERFGEKFDSAFLLIGQGVIQISPQYTVIHHRRSENQPRN